jgi:hypothetical protein
MSNYIRNLKEANMVLEKVCSDQKEQIESFERAIREMIENQKEIPPELLKVLDDNFMDLI